MTTAALAAALALGGTLAQGDGTITTTASTIEAGAAPSQGNVVIEPCAPAGNPPNPPTLDPITIGTQRLATPAAPNQGAGSMGSFATTTNMSIAAGTYEYTDYSVTSSAEVTYQGAVTIRVTGAVLLEGAVLTTAADASITIHCDTFTLNADPSGADHRVHTSGLRSDIEIVAVSRFTTSGGVPTNARSRIEALEGSVLLGQSSTTGLFGMGLAFVDVDADNASIDILTGGPLNLTSTLVTGFGPVRLFAETDDNDNTLTLFETSSVSVTGGNDLIIETQTGDLDVDLNSQVNCNGGTCSLRAYGGDIELKRISSVQNSADVELWAEGKVQLDQAFAGTTDGRVSCKSRSQFVLLRDSTGIGGGPATIGSATGSVSLEAETLVEIQGSSGVSAGGDIAASARDGNVLARNMFSTNFGVSLTADGNVETLGPVQGRHLLVAATNDVCLNSTVTATGQLSVFAGRDIDVSGLLSGGESIEIDAIENVQLRDSTITTLDATGAASGPIVIGAHLAGGTIDATGATIRSGTSDQASGSVSLRVHGGGTAGPTPIDAFIAPKSVRARINARKPQKSFLTLNGTLDTGSAGMPAVGPTTFTAGGVSVNGDLVAKGRSLRLATDDAKLRLVPSRTGNSKARFSFRVKRDLTGLIAAEEVLALQFTNGTIDATGTVQLTGFRFRQGRNPGALTVPSVFPVSCRATLKGDGNDSLTLKLGFQSPGTTPTSAPNVVVTFGDTYFALVFGADLGEPSRERFTARKPDSAPEVSRVTLDYGREFLTISIRGIDLGAFPDDPTVPVTIGLWLTNDQRAVDVVLTRRGNRLTY